MNIMLLLRAVFLPAMLCALVLETSAQEWAWHKPANTPSYEVTCLVVNHDGEVYAGSKDSGVYRSTDNGLSWSTMKESYDTTEISCLGVDPVNRLFMGTQNHVWSWQGPGNPFIVHSDSAHWAWAFACDTPYTYCAASVAVYMIDGNVQAMPYIRFIGHIRAITLDDDKQLYVAEYEPYSSTIQVSKMDPTSPGTLVDFGSVQDRNPGHFMPVLETYELDYVFLGCEAGLFRSPQQAHQWELLTTDDLPVRGIWIHDDTVYVAAHDRGVWYMPVEGDFWTELNDGLTGLTITCIAGDGTNYLYAGTSDGVYRLGLVTNAMIPLAANPASVTIDEIYPHPSTASAVTLDYTLNSFGRVRIAIYDLLGRETAVLQDGYRAAGSHRTVLKTGSIPGGMYIVRLETDNEVVQRIMIALR